MRWITGMQNKIDISTHWLTYWLDWFDDWQLSEWLTDWLKDWFDKLLTYWLDDWLTLWLTDWLTNSILRLLWVYYKLTMWPTPRWLDTCSSISRALHWYRRGHGLVSCLGLNFFQAITAMINHVLMTDWGLCDWLADWLTDELIWLLTDWPTDLMTDWPSWWLTDWLTWWLTYWLNDWLADWVTDLLLGVHDQSVDMLSYW